MNNTTTNVIIAASANASAKKTQLVIAVSDRVKSYVKGLTENFKAPSKSKDEMFLTEREALDALVDFSEAFRYTKGMRNVMETVEIDGETHEVESLDGDGAPIMEEFTTDELALVIGDIMAERMTTSRTNSSTAKVSALEAELEALRAEYAKLKGE